MSQSKFFLDAGFTRKDQELPSTIASHVQEAIDAHQAPNVITGPSTGFAGQDGTEGSEEKAYSWASFSVDQAELAALSEAKPRVVHARFPDPMDPKRSISLPMVTTEKELSIQGVSASLASPGVLLRGAPGLGPRWQIDQLRMLLNVPEDGPTGQGVHVAVVDSGVFSKVLETHPVREGRIDVGRQIHRLVGIWPDDGSTRTNANQLNTDWDPKHPSPIVTLTTSSPTPKVRVVYSFLHEFFHRAGTPDIECVALDGLDPDADEIGHGTAVAAMVHAVAPGAKITAVKFTDATINAPLAAFRRAVNLEPAPHIICCSWAPYSYGAALESEITQAADRGILVVFGSGNGHTDVPLGCPVAMPHPFVLSVGGVGGYSAVSDAMSGPGRRQPREGALQVSEVASGFASVRYARLRRRCPDVCARLGPFVVPTQRHSLVHRDARFLAENDQGAWVAMRGTSLAAPQVAAVAALLLEKHPDLQPMPIVNLLMSTARDIRHGESAGGHGARRGFDSASGWGLVDAGNALAYLEDGFFPFIRTTVQDKGGPVQDPTVWKSPDIILGADSERIRLITVSKHLPAMGLFESGFSGASWPQPLAIRISNRGTQRGHVWASIYVIWDEKQLMDPAQWPEPTTVKLKRTGDNEDTEYLRSADFSAYFPMKVEEPPRGATAGSIIVVVHDTETPPQSFPPADPRGLALRDWVSSNERVAWRWFNLTEPMDPLPQNRRPALFITAGGPANSPVSKLVKGLATERQDPQAERNRLIALKTWNPRWLSRPRHRLADAGATPAEMQQQIEWLGSQAHRFGHGRLYFARTRWRGRDLGRILEQSMDRLRELAPGATFDVVIVGPNDLGGRTFIDDPRMRVIRLGRASEQTVWEQLSQFGCRRKGAEGIQIWGDDIQGVVATLSPATDPASLLNVGFGIHPGLQGLEVQNPDVTLLGIREPDYGDKIGHVVMVAQESEDQNARRSVDLGMPGVSLFRGYEAGFEYWQFDDEEWPAAFDLHWGPESAGVDDARGEQATALPFSGALAPVHSSSVVDGQLYEILTGPLGQETLVGLLVRHGSVDARFQTWYAQPGALVGGLLPPGPSGVWLFREVDIEQLGSYPGTWSVVELPVKS